MQTGKHMGSEQSAPGGIYARDVSTSFAMSLRDGVAPSILGDRSREGRQGKSRIAKRRWCSPLAVSHFLFSARIFFPRII